ncbi:hypothetical protein [Edaphobacter bradus]|uniref:hypothetical protein n=1 Tax=Edaphobacter bradus TaxID=2259016 RepID=UPI0021DFDA96|nr:hypothetical protein [Edaphobacter bradus]
MKRASSLNILAASLLLLTLTTQAEERGYWRAASNTARSITGDITLADEKLTINFSTTPISRVRDLNATELAAVFDTDSNAARTGSLYRLNIPAEKKFLHKNSLCGSEDVHWMVTYAARNSLQLAFFSGEKPPVFTFDAISNSTDLCGTFTYVK